MDFSREERIALKEVNEIIALMGEQYKNKIPIQLQNLLQKEEKNYITRIKKDLPFEKQKISRTALILLNYINRNYWIEDEGKKQRLQQCYKQKEEQYQKMLIEKYNPNEIFKKRGKK